MQAIIEIKNISKRFRISHHKQPYLSIRDSVIDFIHQPFDLKNKTSVEEFWALKDICLDVYEGESIGIIGKNGAGKSTLLKILSRITPPSSGKIVLRGRVASLLEVGTGFHPELTGRENVFFNGAILGMKRSEIKRKFDEIIDFSGVEKFIDTPLKHYSSGMQLRLAFAVAAFLEAEILVVDEVLAVGDAEFQKKCLGKMEEVTKSEGRTVLFVSHNMSAVKQICEKSILIEKGRLSFFSDTVSTLSKYMESNTKNGFSGSINLNKNIIKKIEMKCDEMLSDTFYAGCDFTIDVYFESKDKLEFPVLGVLFKDEYNQPVLAMNNKHYRNNLVTKEVSSGIFRMNMPFFPFFSGNYTIDLYFGNQYRDIEILKDVAAFMVEQKGIKGGIEIPDSKLNKFLVQKVNWSIV